MLIGVERIDVQVEASIYLDVDVDLNFFLAAKKVRSTGRAIDRSTYANPFIVRCWRKIYGM